MIRRRFPAPELNEVLNKLLPFCSVKRSWKHIMPELINGNGCYNLNGDVALLEHEHWTPADHPLYLPERFTLQIRHRISPDIPPGVSKMPDLHGLIYLLVSEKNKRVRSKMDLLTKKTV